jgi:hypothetical protein
VVHAIGAIICTGASTADQLRPLLEGVLTAAGLRIDDAYVCTDKGEPMPAIINHWPGKVFLMDRLCRCVMHLLNNAVEATYKANPLFMKLVDICTHIVAQVRASGKRMAFVGEARAAINKVRAAAGQKPIKQLVGHTIVRFSSRKDLLVSVDENMEALLSINVDDMRTMFRKEESFAEFKAAMLELQGTPATKAAAELLRAQLSELAELLTRVFVTNVETQTGGVNVNVLREKVDALLENLRFWAAADDQVQEIARDIGIEILGRYEGAYPTVVEVAQWFFPEVMHDIRVSLRSQPLAWEEQLKLKYDFISADVKSSFDQFYEPPREPVPWELDDLDEGTEEYEAAFRVALENRKLAHWRQVESELAA